MVFKELGKNIGENQYYKENCYDESKSKISLHLRISPEIANEFTKAIAVYREFGVDKHELIKSEFGEMIIKDFLDNLGDDDAAVIGLIAKMKAFRDGGVING